MNKKGALSDIVMIAVVVFIISIIAIVTFKVSNELNTEFQSNDLITSRGKSNFQKINNMYPGIIDNSFLLLIVGLAIISFAMAAMVRVHPVFIVFFVLIWIILLVVCGAFSVTYNEIASQSEMTAVANELTFISNIMRFLPFIVGILGAALAVVMYKMRPYV